MTRKQALEDCVLSLSYKPGWKFAVEDFMGIDGSRILAMNIQAEAICIDSGEPITIDRSFVFKPDTVLDPPPRIFIEKWVVARIREVEEHEVQEWIKFHGVRWYPEVHDQSGY